MSVFMAAVMFCMLLALACLFLTFTHFSGCILRVLVVLLVVIAGIAIVVTALIILYS